MSRQRRALICGARIVSMAAATGDLTKGDMLNICDHITEIAPSIECDDADAIDAADMIASPGFVDAIAALA